MAAHLNPINHLLTASVLFVASVLSYFYISLRIVDRNWLDIRAVFSLVWLITISLASLRLLDYQEVWQANTWYSLAITYGVFPVGVEVGDWLVKYRNMYPGERSIVEKANSNVLFWLCVGTTVVGLLSFVASMLLKGTPPLFNSNPWAYAEFYTKFHVFSVAATVISGLCYYTIRRPGISKFRKYCLYTCIVYSTLLFPALVVSRGAFLTSALILVTAVYYLRGRKLFILIISLSITVLIYLGFSSFRNLSDAQLIETFEPSTIEIGVKDTTSEITSELATTTDEPSSKKNSSTESSLPPPPILSQNNEGSHTIPFPSVSVTPSSVEPIISLKPNTLEPNSPMDASPSIGQDSIAQVSFSLSPKIAFLYSYLTVSHDNLNEAVQNMEHPSQGVRQFAPFNVLLRIPMPEIEKSYLVRDHLNTFNIVGDAYYDFGMIGILLSVLVWSMLFGAIQGWYLRGQGCFALLALGNTVSAVILSFFAPWMSNFTHWMMWGTALVLYGAYILLSKRGNNRAVSDA